MVILHIQGGLPVGNVLRMEKQQQIRALLDLNWSYRAIEREIGVRRETISRYDHRKAAKVPTEDDSNAANCPPMSRSSAASYDEAIRNGLKTGHSAQRIYQDLQTQHQAEVSYDAIKRYCRKLKKESPKVFARLHSLPGSEAQVDFGTGAPTRSEKNYRRPWLFKMVLSYSRHSYEEVVWHQDVETFVRCHERAFSFFGGVPKTVKLDNLKSGVLSAHLFEPELNPVYQQFADHYGFIALPCLPRRPEHKGKVEAGVKYTQDNALKGCRFESIDEQNAYLRRWNRQWARTRIHGTTKVQVQTMFLEELPALGALPEKAFQYFKVGLRTVHADGHIEVGRSYYSVPHSYLGRRVKVLFNSQWVKVFDPQTNLAHPIAFHRVTVPGRFRTERTHFPETKTFTAGRYAKYLIEQCRIVGEECEQWARIALECRDQRAFRPIQGTLYLKKKYGGQLVNQACADAIKLESFRYHTIRRLCEDAADNSEPQMDLIQEHELIRGSNEYAAILSDRVSGAM